MAFSAAALRMPKLRSAVAQTPSTPWRSAYNLAQTNAIVFLALSSFCALAEVTSPFVNASVAVVFFLGSLWSYISFVRAGGGVAAISYFVLGTGIYFGFGTAYSVIGTERVFIAFFSHDQQERWLRYINLMNALSVLAVIIGARAWSIGGPRAGARTSEITASLPFVATLRITALLLSIPILALIVATFPRPENQLLANAEGLLRQVPVASTVLAGIQWRRSRLVERVLAMAIVAALVVLGLLNLSKTDVIIPIVGLFAGLLLGLPSPRRLVPAFVVVLLFYAFAVAPIVNEGRAYPTYGPENTMGQRAQILAVTWDRVGQTQEGGRRAAPFWTRVALAPVQAFLLQQRDAGHPGTSFEGAWAAMIPRVIWRDKPIITRFGEDLDANFFRRANSGSALAPTYTGEILWNLGWVGLVVVSLLIGLEIGWMTRKWNDFTHRPTQNVGILVFSLPAILLAVRAETWVVSSYVGGFVTLLISVKALDYGMPFLTSLSRRRRVSPGVAARMRSKAAP